MQKAAGKEVDPEWIYDEFVKGSNYHANAKLVSAIIDKSSSTVDWLVDNGVNLELLDAGYGSQYAHVGMPTTAHGYKDGGEVAIATIHDKVKANGGEVMYETPATELLFDENKKVIGVVATKADGTVLHIKADSVVLATGGFGGNKEMMTEVFGEKAGTGLVSTATGDGLNMAWSAGAAELGTMMYMQPDAEMYVIFDKGIIDEVAKRGLADVFVDRWGHLYGQGVSYSEAGHVSDLDKMCEENRTPVDFTATVEDAINAGADAGGMYGDSYVTFEGGTLGFAYNSGRIAGENAAKNVKATK